MVHGELSSVLARFHRRAAAPQLPPKSILARHLAERRCLGAASDQVMTEEHEQEHEEPYADIFGISSAPEEFAGAATRDLATTSLSI